MRLIIVCGMYPPIQTGTSYYAKNLAAELQKNGNQIHVVTIGDVGSRLEDGINVHRIQGIRLPLAGFFKHYQFSAWNLINWWRIIRITRRSKADGILLINHYLDIALLAKFAAWLLRIPLAISVGTQLQSLNSRRDRVLNIMDRLICGNIVLRGCSSIVAWDNQIIQYIRDTHGSRFDHLITLINYGVNGDANSLISCAHNYATNDAILGVGAVSEQRSFIPLVRAVAELAPRYPSLKLRVIGHVYYDAAPRLARELGLGDRIQFLGERPHPEVLEHMKHASVFYSSLTGKYVGLGTATIEAMLLGVPTVVNTPLDLIGKGLLVDKETLVQCRETEPTLIAQKIDLLLADRRLRQRIGMGGRNFVNTHLRWDVVARDFEKLFEQLCNQ